MTPKARSASLNAASHTALSPLAAFALAHADGQRSVGDLAALAAAQGMGDWTRDAVFRALDELADLGLLEARVAPPAGRSSVRRAAVASADALGVAPGIPLWASNDDDARKSAEEKEKKKAEQSDKKATADSEQEARKAEQSDKRTAEQSDKIR